MLFNKNYYWGFIKCYKQREEFGTRKHGEFTKTEA